MAILNITTYLSIAQFAAEAKLDEATAEASVKRLVKRGVLEEFAKDV